MPRKPDSWIDPPFPIRRRNGQRLQRWKMVRVRDGSRFPKSQQRFVVPARREPQIHMERDSLRGGEVTTEHGLAVSTERRRLHRLWLHLCCPSETRGCVELARHFIREYCGYATAHTVTLSDAFTSVQHTFGKYKYARITSDFLSDRSTPIYARQSFHSVIINLLDANTVRMRITFWNPSCCVLAG